MEYAIEDVRPETADPPLVLVGTRRPWLGDKHARIPPLLAVSPADVERSEASQLRSRGARPDL